MPWEGRPESRFFRKLAQLGAGASYSHRGRYPDLLESISSLLLSLLLMLNEKQRHLYLGLESLRLGRGADLTIAPMTGVNGKTVAHGHRRSLARKVTTERVR